MIFFFQEIDNVLPLRENQNLKNNGMMTQPAVILLEGHRLPRNYKVLAIIATFICLPLGIPASN